MMLEKFLFIVPVYENNPLTNAVDAAGALETSTCGSPEGGLAAAIASGLWAFSSVTVRSL